MARRTYTIKTIKETDPEVFDSKVNQLLSEVYKLDKSRVITIGDEIFFIAFTRYTKREEKKPKGSKAPEKEPMAPEDLA